MIMPIPEIIATVLFAIAYFVTYWFRGLLWDAQLKQAKKDGGIVNRFFISPKYTVTRHGNNAMKQAGLDAIKARGEKNVKTILLWGILLPMIGATLILILNSGQ